MLIVLRPIEKFEDDAELHERLVKQCYQASKDNPNCDIEDFLLDGELFPEEEYIVDSASGNCFKANDYARRVIDKRNEITV